METDVLIIGGGPAAVVAAVTARKNNADKKITLVRDKEKAVIPCGIPYIFHRLDSVEKNIMSDKGLEANKIELIVDEAINLNVAEKKVGLKNSEEISYDKLVLATGSKPGILPVAGSDKVGVWVVKKDFEYLCQMREAVLGAEKIVIVGAGFIGVELAEELSRTNKQIHVIQRSNRCLTRSFDEEFAVLAEERLKANDVSLHYGCSVEMVEGDERVGSIKLSSGESLEADMVIFSIGAKPNVDLAKEAGIELGDYEGIEVDEYMRTKAEDVFAVGDCSETRDFFTGRYIPVMLASTAATEARIAAINLYHLEDLRENQGTLAAFSTCIDGLVMGAVGLIQDRADKEEFDVIVGMSECPNHHPGTLPETEKTKVKLLFSKKTKVLLGAQVAGPESVSEMINILALAIQSEQTMYDFNILQISTHPLLTAAPTVYPLITAAQAAMASVEK